MNTSSDNSDSAVPYRHILQTTGLLKSFGIAKVVRGDELRELKRLLKSVSTSKEEYETMLQTEMEKLSQMGNSKNPVPGMILVLGTKARSVAVLGGAKAYAKKLKQLGWSRSVMSFYILVLIKELGLNQSDFDAITDGQTDSDVQSDDCEDDEDDS